MKLSLRIIASLLLISMVSIWLAPVVVQIHFVMNQEEITEEFCENITLPELQCNGQCHLAKTLKQIDPIEDHSENAETVLPQFIVLGYFLEEQELSFTVPVSEHSFAYHDNLQEGFTLLPERPPAA